MLGTGFLSGSQSFSITYSGRRVRGPSVSAGLLAYGKSLISSIFFEPISYLGDGLPIFCLFLGLILGLFVGLIIVYQILYTDVTDHLGEYATLKAMGYRDGFLAWIVVQESAILSIFGFLPGLAIAYWVYHLAASATLLPLQMTRSRIVMVYLLTLAMCAVSGLLAVRRLRSADPAEIF